MSMVVVKKLASSPSAMVWTSVTPWPASSVVETKVVPPEECVSELTGAI